MDTATRSTVLEKVENYLAFMELADRDIQGMKGATKEHHFPLSVFRNAEPFGDTEDLVGEDRIYDLREQDPSRLSRAVDICLIVPIRNDDGAWDDKGFGIRRLKTMTREEARGRIAPFTPHTVEERWATVESSGLYRGNHTIWGYVGGEWRGVKNYGSLSLPAKEEDGPDNNRIVGIAHQHAIYRDMLWHSSIGYTGHSASLLIPCSAEATLDLFRYRDLPNGRARRQALLHWVSEHWRRKPSNPEDAIKILEHLRGQTVFQWQNGLSVQILPASEDLKRLKDDAVKKNLTTAVSA